MKHLFLAGRRVDSVEVLRALFSGGGDTEALYAELRSKFEEGSVDRWLQDQGVCVETAAALSELCAYQPSSVPAFFSHSEEVRRKQKRLRTTSWFREGVFPPTHDWYATATTNSELEELIEQIREASEQAGEVYEITLCHAGETFCLNPRQVGRLRIMGFGMPVVRLQCSYRERIDLRRLPLYFSSVKIESSAPCRLLTSGEELRSCTLGAGIEVLQKGSAP